MDHVKNEMPSKGFAEMLGDLHRFVSFMNMTVSYNTITTGGTACLLHVYDRDGLHEKRKGVFRPHIATCTCTSAINMLEEATSTICTVQMHVVLVVLLLCAQLVHCSLIT